MTMSRIRYPGAFTPAVILLAGAVLTGLATWQLASVVRARTHDRFQRAVEQTRLDVTTRMETYIEMLRGGAGLVAAHGIPNRAQFHHYIERLEIEERYPGLQGIGLSLRVPSSDLDSVLADLRTEDPFFKLLQNEPRDEYFLIVAIEPLDDRNRAALGYDMFMHPVRREAMVRARDTGQAAASGAVRLVQEIHGTNQPGFLVYLPVYEGGSIPTTVEDRRRLLRGFVYAAFRGNDLLEHIAAIQRFPSVGLEVYDQVVSEASRLRIGPLLTEHAAGDLKATADVEVAGRRWTLQFAAQPTFDTTSGTSLIFAIGGTGMTFTLLLFWLALAQQRARIRAEQTAEELQRSAANIESSQLRLRAILDSAMDAVISMDLAGIVTEWNNAAAKTFGYSREEALGRPLADLIIPPYLHEHHYKGLARYAAGGSGRAVGHRFETMALRADRSELPVELSIVRVGTDDPATFTGFLRDITERRRDEKHRELMTRELDHRVKNNLSTVVALVDQTASRSASFTDFVSSFSGRVRAMARLHEMLAHNRWTGADLGEVIRGIMAPYMTDDPSRVIIEGEPLDLPDKIVSPLCLALHEMATNAGKYGALSTPNGHVKIRWETTGERGSRTLTLHWAECGGPRVEPPTRRGFGTELVERGLAYEIRARASITYAPEGVQCEISLAIPDDVTVQRRSRPIRVTR